MYANASDMSRVGYAKSRGSVGCQKMARVNPVTSMRRAFPRRSDVQDIQGGEMLFLLEGVSTSKGALQGTTCAVCLLITTTWLRCPLLWYDRELEA